MKSPWFILELQCYVPSALAPTPCHKTDKVNYTSVFLHLSNMKATGVFPICVSYVDGPYVLLLSPCFFHPSLPPCSTCHPVVSVR